MEEGKIPVIYFLCSSSSLLLLIFMCFDLPNLSANNVSSRFQYEQLNVRSEEKQRALREVKETVLHRKHLDSSIDFIGKLVFGFEGPSVLEATKGPGQPLVDDWDCLETMVSVTIPCLQSHKYATPCSALYFSG